MGHRRVGRLTTGDIQDLTEAIVAANSPNTARQIVGVLSGALSHAVRTDVILPNPCQLVELPRAIKPIHDDTLSADEVVRFVRACESTRWEAFAALALGYGCRRGELLALKGTDVTLDEEPTVRIAATIKWPPGGS